MERDVTVSVRSVVLAGVVLLALVAGWVLGGSGARTPARAAGDEAPAAAPVAASADRRTVEMTGVGSVSAVPDEVGFGVSVGMTRTDLSTALDDASATMARVLARLADFGVAKDRVQTTGLAMNPVYDYPRYGPPVLRGYRVTQRARVTVPELDRAGGAIAAAVQTGGNAVRIGDIRLLVGDRDGMLEKARDAAVAAATAKAEQYAEATGQTLGDVLSLREARARSPRASYQVAYKALRAADAVTVPIKAGEDQLKVTVRVVWAFG
ncbi:MAG: SIMPL domain-containing protein [Nocardioides sp.]